MSTLKAIFGEPDLVTFSMHPISQVMNLLACTQKDISVFALHGRIKLCVKVPSDAITLLTVIRRFFSHNEFYEPMPDIKYLELNQEQCKPLALSHFVSVKQFHERGFEQRGPALMQSRKVSRHEAEQGYPIVPVDNYYYVFVDKTSDREEYDSLHVQLFNNERIFALDNLYISNDELKKLATQWVSEWADEQRELGCLSPLPSAPTAPDHHDETPTPVYDAPPPTDFYCKNFPSSFTPHVNISESLTALANLTDSVRCLVESNLFDRTKLNILCEEFFPKYSKTDIEILKSIACPLAFRANNVNDAWSDKQRESEIHLTPEVLAAFDVSEKFWSTFNKKNMGDPESYPEKPLIIDFLKKEHRISSKNRAELIEKIARTANRPAGRPKTRK